MKKQTVTILSPVKARGEIILWKRWICHAYLEERNAVQSNSTAREKPHADSATTFCMIWKQDVASDFCIATGDYLLRGEQDAPLLGVPLKGWLLEHPDSLTVTSVDSCLYGSPPLQHWEVSAR